MSHPSLALAAGLVALVALPSAAAAEPLTLADALARAVESQPSLRAARLEAEARRAEANAIRGRALPVVKVKATALAWDAPHDLKVDVSPVAALLRDFEPLLASDVRDKLATLKRDGIALPIHDRFTLQAGVTVAQPLTQLYKVLAGWRAQEELEHAARADEVTARRQVELDVSKAFHGLVAAERLHATTTAAIRQVEAVEGQVKSFLDHGVVESNALLKVEVQKADLLRKAFQAEKGAELARAMLNLQMGRALDTPIEPVVGDVDLGVASDAAALRALQDRAVADRPELRSARGKRRAAHLAKDVAVGDFLPQLTAVATYTHSEGFGDLVKKNELYAGAVLEWNAFEWGAGWYPIKAAEARAAMAEELVRAGEDKVRLEVESKRLDVEEAKKSLDVARSAAAQATESLRLEKAHFAAEESTVTELLGAQTLSVQADNEVAVAEMRLAEARLALVAATGRDLVEATRAASGGKR
jgi:outer membrane protein TolC